jgi:hypothetical protein
MYAKRVNRNMNVGLKYQRNRILERFLFDKYERCL